MTNPPFIFGGKVTAVADQGYGQLYVDPFTTVLSLGPVQKSPPSDGSGAFAFNVAAVPSSLEGDSFTVYILCIAGVTGYLGTDSATKAILANGPTASTETPFASFCTAGQVPLSGTTSGFNGFDAVTDEVFLYTPTTDGSNPSVTFSVTFVTPSLTTLLASGEEGWANADLRNVDFSLLGPPIAPPATVLQDASLAGAILSWTDANGNVTGQDLSKFTLGSAIDFTNARMAGVVFPVGVDLTSAKFTGADLTGCDLTQVKLSPSVDFSRCNLTNAKVAGLDLHNARFVGATLNGVDWTKVTMPTGGVLSDGTQAFGPGSASTAASFVGATLNASTLGGQWSYLDLTNATIVADQVITNLDASYTKLNGANADTLQTTTTSDGAISFAYAQLIGTSLHAANLEGADFSSAQMFGAHLTEANLQKTTWVDAYLGAKQQICVVAIATNDVTTLDGGTLPADVQTQMTQAGVVFAGASLITVVSQVKDTQWLVTVISASAQDTYTIKVKDSTFVVISNNRTPAILDGAFLTDAVLDEGSFAQVSFLGAIWVGNNVTAKNADFEQAKFSGAVISSSVQNYPDLSGATSVSGASFASAFLASANFQGLDLSPSFSDAAVSFESAVLTGTSFAGAVFDGVNLDSAFVAIEAGGATPPIYGTPLFTVDASLVKSLATVTATPTTVGSDVANAFNTYNYAVSGAMVNLIAKDAQWYVNAGLPAPAGPGVSNQWTAFTILAPPTGTTYTVYGNVIWVSYPAYASPNANQTVYSIPTTGSSEWLLPATMTPTTTCPNGDQYDAIGANSWDQVMTPASDVGPFTSTTKGAK
ncbi:MAG: pentapeptide repeat-containing protein [Gemmatimonadota bacterium]